MPQIYKTLFYLNQINGTEENRRYMEEILDVCKFSPHEAKKTLYAFQCLAKVVSATYPYERDMRIRWMLSELRWGGFRFREMKENPGNHIMIRFFNLLVSFCNGTSAAFDSLLECIRWSDDGNSFDFRWEE